MSIQDDVDAILVALEARSQRCTYNALAAFLDISLPQLFSALGDRRPRASWIVNQKTLKPTKYTKHQEHPNLFFKKEVISSDKSLLELLGQLSKPTQEGAKLENTEIACYGVDGCKGGWLYAKLQKGLLSFGTVSLIENLVEMAADRSRIFIDIPIGLRQASSEPRLCDKEARQVLKPYRTSSVFNAPIREILTGDNYSSANALSKKLIAKGISQQSFNITDKIREVDDLLRNSTRARNMIREIHPEVCFSFLANGSPMKDSKKSQAGFNARLALIERHIPRAKLAIFAALEHYPRSTVAKDDVLDAVVAVITASRPEAWTTLPASPELDAFGLPMEMVYLKS